MANDLPSKAESFNLNDEKEELFTGAAWRNGDRSAKTLVKTPDLRLVLVALKEGAALEEHHVDGRTIIHTLSGTLRVSAVGATRQLEVGDLLVLDRGVAHEVAAVEDAAFLLTLALAAK
jgi:quercetin dioxygenase-like cupin family protein